MRLRIISVVIRNEHDVVTARRRARHIAALLGFESQDQTRIATAVSEIARNAFAYAQGGRVEFEVEGRTAPQVLLAKVSDQGPGIADLDGVLAGTYTSRTGLGLGIIGARRLVDQFHVESRPGEGTTVFLRKLFPRGLSPVGPADGVRIAGELARAAAAEPLHEIQEQNQELIRTLDELRARQEELERLNGELEDTNRGVVALYAELEEKADHLRRADDLKSRFLSNMTHEFRTPVNSILALSRLLLDRVDGDLTVDQAKQVGFIEKAARDLSELVNDLLDLAKVEAGRTTVNPGEFSVGNLFGALRGMLRPLLVTPSVNLVFEDLGDLPPVVSDESKVSQILRNFISNALKFTERGEVRVSARIEAATGRVVFAVADTGIGIAKEDQDRIFQEFAQIDSPLQRRVKGTGLGLPLTRKLAELLGGSVDVESELGCGSTFTLTIPRVWSPATAAVRPIDWRPDPSRIPVLVVEDTFEEQLVYEKYFKTSRYQAIGARSLREARHALLQARPRAIVLDVLLRGEDSWAFLSELKRSDETSAIPVVVVTTVDDANKGRALGADAYAVKPVDRAWLLETLERLVESRRRVLVIDDDETSRYLIRQALRERPWMISDAGNAVEGLRRAREERPDVILLDLVMPGMTGFEAMAALKANPETSRIPVVVVSGKRLSDAEKQDLRSQAVAIVAKDDPGPLGPQIERALAEAGLT